MSFILDALRKSESERHRDNVPDIMRIPLAPARHDLPRWVVPVTSLLSLAIVGLAAAWWISASSDNTARPAQVAASEQRAGTAAEPAAREATIEPSAGRVAGESPAPAEPAPEREIVPLNELATRPSERRSGEPAVRSTETTVAESASPASEPASPAPEPVGSLPRRSDLIAEGLAVPELGLELHAYGETPSSRFVFINGSKYLEGETLASGQKVVRITPEGVVLAHEGRRFLLLRN